jgi:L-lactate dehydrogenase complex protein LldF
MKVESQNFIPAAQIAIRNPNIQEAVTTGTRNSYVKRNIAMSSPTLEHGEAMRYQAAAAKRRALSKLPELLEKAEANMQANGMVVQWAQTAEEVCQMVVDIAKKHNVRLVAKGKSMVTEEVALNDAIEAAGMEVIETDLGEFIVQIGKTHPSHLLAPIIHMTKAEIRDVMVREIGMPPTDDAGEMTQFAQAYLRRYFLEADMGISGGNFILAETGSICLVTNEGNGRMCTTLPRVHVAVVGIEKVVENVRDYATLTQVLPRSGTGQVMTVYTHMINGPRRPGESDGPEHVYVILVDNRRTEVYATDYAEALACIRCGACQNACPVYRSTGGHAYGWVYAGPIGAIVTPLLTGLENAKPLPQASSLCGACKQVCPVDIDIPRMLLELRHDLVERGETETKWNLGLRFWAFGNKSPRLFQMGGSVARFGRNHIIKGNLPGPLSGWTQYRDFPEFAPKSFHQLWKERQAGKGNGGQSNGQS